MDVFASIAPQIRLNIVDTHNDEAVFGRGVATLCCGVREYGSLNKAAKSINMAYSKAWRIIKNTEAAFGIQLLNRDGAHGSTLTPEACRLLDAYEEVQRKSSAYAAQVLEECLQL